MDLHVLIRPNVKVMFVNRFVKDLVQYTTTGPIIRAANEISEAPVVKSAIEIAKETSEKVSKVAAEAARRKLERAVDTETVPLLPRLKLSLGRITLIVPTKTSSVSATMTSLEISNGGNQESRTYNRETLSDLRLDAVGLSVSTPKHVLVGTTDARLKILIESTQSIAIDASLSAIRVAISPEHLKLLTADLIRDNLSVAGTDKEEKESNSKIAEEKKNQVVKTKQEKENIKNIPKPTLRLKFCASGFGLQLLKSNKGYEKDEMWKNSKGIWSNPDSELALELTELGVQLIGNVEKFNLVTKLPFLRLYRACERLPILRLDVQNSQPIGVTMSMSTKGKPERVSISFPGLAISLIEDSTKFFYATTTHGSITMQPNELSLSPVDIIVDDATSSTNELATIRKLTVRGSCSDDSVPFIGDPSETSLFVASTKMELIVSNEFVRDIIPQLSKFADRLANSAKRFSTSSDNTIVKTTKATTTIRKKEVKPLHIHLDTVISLRLLDMLKAVPTRSQRDHFLKIELNPKLRLTIDGPTTSLELSIRTFLFEQMLRMNEKLDKQYILVNKPQTNFASVSLSKRHYVSPGRHDRVRARFQISPIIVRADTLLIMDLLDFVSSMDGNASAEEIDDNLDDDEKDHSQKLSIDPEFSISKLNLNLTFDVNSDLHDLMKKLKVVKNRYRLLEPVCWGEMLERNVRARSARTSLSTLSLLSLSIHTYTYIHTYTRTST